MSATPPTYEQLYGFVEAIASMTLDGKGGFELEDDDPVETQLRDLLGTGADPRQQG